MVVVVVVVTVVVVVVERENQVEYKPGKFFPEALPPSRVIGVAVPS